jgi:hypothetical protein
LQWGRDLAFVCNFGAAFVVLLQDLPEAVAIIAVEGILGQRVAEEDDLG